MDKQVFSAAAAIEDSDSKDVLCLKSLSRNQYATIADDTLEKLKVGWYRPAVGPRILLEEDVAFSMKNSQLYTEVDLQNPKKLILIDEETNPTLCKVTSSSYPEIEVRHCTTLQAARSFVAEIDEDRVGVLNFASAKNPGGGFLRGSNAQEESLARSSSLYLVLTQSQFLAEYYQYNRRGRGGIYSHRLIYSPRVTIFKV